jgi:hypothetical protein
MRARRRAYKGTPEGAVLASVLEYLAAERIWHRRNNTRVVDVAGKGGRTRPMFFGTAGMADVLATPWLRGANGPSPLWIECKSSDGRQSEAQREFELEVTEAGHDYLVARSIDDVREWLEKRRCA